MKKKVELPLVNFKVRTGDDYSTDSTGGCPIGGEWINKTTDDYFKGKRVVLFSLPGAFTPTCSAKQLPGFEKLYDKIRTSNIDEIYCISVNDSFVMNAWAYHSGIKKVKMIADGTGEFTRGMGMLIEKPLQGFGMRSWRYMAVVKDGVVENWWQEPGINNESVDKDPYEETTPDNIVNYLTSGY